MGENAYSYDYDPIGTRLQSTVAVGRGQPGETSCAANALNQYSAIHSQSNSLIAFPVVVTQGKA